MVGVERTQEDAGVGDSPASGKAGKTQADMDTLEAGVDNTAHVGRLIVDVRSHTVDEGREVAEAEAEAAEFAYLAALVEPTMVVRMVQVSV